MDKVPGAGGSSPLSLWQAKVVKRVLRIGAVVGAIALVPSLYADVIEGLFVLAGVSVAAYAVLLVLALKPGAAGPLHALGLILTFQTVSAVLLWYLGPTGGAVSWYVAALAFGGLILTRQQIIFTFGLAVAIWVLIATASFLHWTPWRTNPVAVWTHGINALAAALLVAAGTHALLQTMQRAYLRQRSLRTTLRSRNLRLHQANAALELESWHKETLLRELHHRVKNNLQLLTSYSRIKYGDHDDNSAARGMQRRTHCLARIHELHYGTTVAHKIPLHAVLEAVVASLASDRVGVEVSVEPREETPGLHYGDSVSIPLALLLCELLEPWMDADLEDRRTIRARQAHGGHISLRLYPALAVQQHPGNTAAAGEIADALAAQLRFSVSIDAIDT
jgi:hypothetical protein